MQRKEKGKRDDERKRETEGRNSQRMKEEMPSEIKPQRDETSAEAEAGGRGRGWGQAGGPAPPTQALPLTAPHPTLCWSHSPSAPCTSAPQLCQLPHAGQMGPIPRRTRQDPKPLHVPSCHPTHISKPFKPQKSHHLQDALASCPHPWFTSPHKVESQGRDQPQLSPNAPSMALGKVPWGTIVRDSSRFRPEVQRAQKVTS